MATHWAHICNQDNLAPVLKKPTYSLVREAGKEAADY